MFAKSTFGIPMLFAVLAFASNVNAASLEVVTGYSPIIGATQHEPGFDWCGGNQGAYASCTNPGNLAPGATVASAGDLVGCR